MSQEELVIKKENILFDFESDSVEKIIIELANKLYLNNDIEDREKFVKAVLKRENEIPTSIGNEIAIPHGKSESVVQSTIALCVLKDTIQWGEGSNDKVKYIFMLAIKEADKEEKHLKTLANLSSQLMNNDFVNSFKNANTKNELFNIINNK